MNRRNILEMLAVGGATALSATRGFAMTSEGQGGSREASRAGGHEIKPLPFDAKALHGLSERMIISHWENNYGGAVKNLNKLEEELSRVTRETPPFLVSGLKERELQFTNSMILHELYFANLGGGGGTPTGPIATALSEASGSLARWEELFRAVGLSLSGGSGWAVLGLNLHNGGLRTYWSGNHTQALAFGRPLLVMDMYEHAYQIDYGAAAARYVDAFFQNINWDEVNRRYGRAGKAAASL